MLQIVLTAALFCQAAGDAAPILIQSRSFSASSVSTATHYFVADGAAMSVVPGGVSFPLAEPTSQPIVFPEEGRFAVPLRRRDTLQSAWVSEWVEMSPAPLRRLGVGTMPWDSEPANVMLAGPIQADGPLAIWAGRRSDAGDWDWFQQFERQSSRGKAPLFVATATGGTAPQPLALTWSSKDELHAAYPTTEGIEVSSSGDPQRAIAWNIELPDAAWRNKAVAVRDDTVWLAVTSNRIEGAQADRHTTIFAGRYGVAQAAVPIEIAGRIVRDGIVPVDDTQALVVTVSELPKARWMYRVVFESGINRVAGLREFSEPSAPLPAVSAQTGEMLAADGNRLYRAAIDRPDDWVIVRTFDNPITCVAYEYGRWFVGTGMSLHRLDDRFETIGMCLAPKGRIEGITALDRSMWPEGDADLDGVGVPQEPSGSPRYRNPDLDGDGIPDGLDPKPPLPSKKRVDLDRARLRLSHERGGSSTLLLGEDIRLVSVSTVNGESASDWLSIEETTVSGLSALRFRPLPEFSSGSKRLVLKAQDIYSYRYLAGGEWPIEVTVAPPRQDTRSILWIDGKNESSLRGRPELMTVLSVPPHFFSHEFASTPVDMDGSEHSVVVANIGLAARGLVMRGNLLDFVREGGGLLLWLDELDDAATIDLVNFWLEAFGAVLAAGDADATTVARRDHPAVRFWPDSLRSNQPNRMRFVLDALGTNLVADERGCILGERIIGRGRVMFLATPEALAAPLERGRAERFGPAIIEWLAESRRRLRDLDGDGLADALEDRDGSGEWDPGETNFLAADTDDDGIPDGVEDANANGIWDPIETHALMADSDSDGIVDGADLAPLPSFGTMALASLEPASGPLEGGTFVEINGRSLPPDAEVFFGPYRAPRVRPASDNRLLAASPPVPMGVLPGPVDITVRSAAEAQETRLPGGFTFTDRGVVELAWSELAAIAEVYDGYTGQVSLNLALDSLVPESLEIAISIEPGGALHAVEWAPGASVTSLGGSADFNRVFAQAWQIRFSNLKEPVAGAPLVLFTYRAIPERLTGRRFRFQVNSGSAYTRSGGELDVTMPGMNIATTPP